MTDYAGIYFPNLGAESHEVGDELEPEDIITAIAEYCDKLIEDCMDIGDDGLTPFDRGEMSLAWKILDIVDGVTD